MTPLTSSQAAAIMGRKGGKTVTPKKLAHLRSIAKSGGRKITCTCGACKKCKNREYQRQWRARQTKTPH